MGPMLTCTSPGEAWWPWDPLQYSQTRSNHSPLYWREIPPETVAEELSFVHSDHDKHESYLIHLSVVLLVVGRVVWNLQLYNYCCSWLQLVWISLACLLHTCVTAKNLWTALRHSENASSLWADACNTHHEMWLMLTITHNNRPANHFNGPTVTCSTGSSLVPRPSPDRSADCASNHNRTEPSLITKLIPSQTWWKKMNLKG